MTIQEELALICEKAKENHTPEMLRLAFSCIDLTTLNPTDTPTHVRSFAARVNDFEREHSEFPNVAAICVYPNLVQAARKSLKAKNVRLAAVAGCFPSSMSWTELKVREARMAVEAGANEIDIVLPLWAFLDDDFDTCREEIKQIRMAIYDAHLKVILESGVLADPAKIKTAAELAIGSGADFIKTSTGKMPQSATPEAAVIMCKAIAAYYQKTGKKIGFKPAGGIVTTGDAILYLSIVRHYLGDDWLSPSLFRIGASRLANNLLSEITKKEIVFF